MYSHNIELDKPRKLRFDHNAMADVEDAAHIGIDAMVEKSMGFAFLRWVLWATAKHEEPTLTLKQAGNIIDTALSPKGEGGLGMDLQDFSNEMLECCKKGGIIREKKKDTKGGDDTSPPVAGSLQAEGTTDASTTPSAPILTPQSA